MPAVGEVTAAVGRPRHDVRDAGNDLLIAARAPVGLRGRVAGDRSDKPLTIAGIVHAFDAASGPLFVQRGHVDVGTVVAARAHEARVRSPGVRP
jgi:hypothetical protein